MGACDGRDSDRNPYWAFSRLKRQNWGILGGNTTTRDGVSKVPKCLIGGWRGGAIMCYFAVNAVPKEIFESHAIFRPRSRQNK